MVNLYRKNVGMMILNNKNEILVGRRIDHPSGKWQMPQGGIDENENPEKAVWREMLEEIGTNNARMLHQSSQWLNYDIPQETLDILPWGRKYKGQTQKWFVFRFEGNDEEINISTKNPEFNDWKWTNHNSLTDNIVPFKKNIYRKVLEEFIELF